MSEKLIMGLIYIGLNIVAITIYLLKDNNKIEIMDVSSEIRKIDSNKKSVKERVL